MENSGSERALLYKEIEVLTEKKNSPILVRKKDTKEFFVKKCYPLYLEENLVTLQKIKHAHLPKIQELLVQDGKLWLYEEFIHGKTLTELIQSSEVIGTDQIIDIAMAVLEALGALHSKGLVHRDIKPGNIMLTNDGTVKLIDFDAVRVFDGEKENDTVQLGTIGFASPEQFGFAESDERSDLYSLGVVMNICSVKEYPKKQLTFDPALRGIIRKATKLEPADRYQSALEMHQALRQRRAKQEYAARQALLHSNASKERVNETYSQARYTAEPKSKHRFIVGNHRWWRGLSSFFKAYVPGFRTEQQWKRIVASVSYAILVIGIVGNVTDQSETSLKVKKLLDYFFILIFPLLLGTNFLNFQKSLPLLSSDKKGYRYIGYGLLFLFWFVVTGIYVQINPPT